MHLLVLDNLDSFTYMLVDYLKQAGATCRVVRNTTSLDELTAEAYDGVVLSPGPGTPRQAGCLLNVIEHYHDQLPMLGVCLGHQALGEYFGAQLVKAIKPMHGKLSMVRKQTDDALLMNLPREFRVTRYHSLVLVDLPTELIPLAATIEGENMAFRHRNLPLWGIQFHPEAALTECGLEILRNWITFVKTTK
ncbi:aminodeoxychorismate/anthranilate synthase component II [Larkinella knui]|uniref:Aminodeoxychorismate/anthranilate synthase component II n=1 Tax=Larkinella knui TaxID=2025310 RepID=A0A3P1CER8_9BACT|nr:aminodeoxychorismate/anthranilate synthase component II [Larkinella knui]RRB11737.1 aminodeoxychorismate/anthranilate synthase component II [Larkinella knui]